MLFLFDSLLVSFSLKKKFQSIEIEQKIAVLRKWRIADGLESPNSVSSHHMGAYRNVDIFSFIKMLTAILNFCY